MGVMYGVVHISPFCQIVHMAKNCDWALQHGNAVE